MPRSDPLPDWKGQDAFIIGGGPSLRVFDFQKLSGKNTIGCNQAFRLGSDLCNICVWGDEKFWESYKGMTANDKGSGLETYQGWVVTNFTFGKSPASWLKSYPRLDDGLGTGETLGWNFNSGCAATNLALILGARRVFLLGFDMTNSNPANSHWHQWSLESQCEQHYQRFNYGFGSVARDLPTLFPRASIINVTDGSSRLKHFSRATMEEVFNQEEAVNVSVSN